MSRGFYVVILAQTFSSLADNALFIAAIALIHQLEGPVWVPPLIKWGVAASYVLLAPFVGAIADAYPKGKVMFTTNAFKVIGCILMFSYGFFGLTASEQIILICAAYAVVGTGAAAYSPAKYGIITEMLPPEKLVVGNSWIEGMTVVSIIMGSVVGGLLVSPAVSGWLLSHDTLKKMANTPAEVAILMIGLLYIAAALTNLLIPKTNAQYPKQHQHPIRLIRAFAVYTKVLWTDKLGQISLGVTTLFWGAGATLQLIVIEWGRSQLGYRLDQASILMGIAALGTVLGSIAAARVPLKQSLRVLPVGALMGLVVLVMPLIYNEWAVYGLLLVIGILSGFFVVPMNALLQHRGHLLLSAGHSIAVQNFNEQLNILLMVSLYSLMLWLGISINTIIVMFGLSVAILMLVLIRWHQTNLRKDPNLLSRIGEHGQGQAL
ncbi:MAG: lysophospholipid transporter LplT [Alcaligenaceae bacterium]|nr:lysophospholipid transporter LplT [Alcaligenaceae bacterium]